MGQVIFNKQKVKLCNLKAIQTAAQRGDGKNGSKYNEILDDGEIWVVDSTNSDKGFYGTGKYDSYIKGDGVKTANQLLPAIPIDPAVPTQLSELNEDATHRLVTDAEKTSWNSKQPLLKSGVNIKTINNRSLLGEGNITIEGGGEGDNPVDDEDLTLVEQDGVNVIKFKDKAYSPQNYSGLGRKYLRKNIQSVAENTLSSDYEYTKGAFIDIANVGVGETVNMTPTSREQSAYCVVDVQEGDSFLVSGSVNGSAHRVWGFVDSNNVLLLKNNTMTISLAFGSEVITAPADGKLIVNTYRPRGLYYRLAKIIPGEVKQLNVLTQEMLNSENTAYIIQYDYTLNFGNVTIPKGCKLIFDGGSIVNGGLIGNNSLFVENDNRQIFNLDTYLCGTWVNDIFTPELFGAKGESNMLPTSIPSTAMDCYLHIQKCLDTIRMITDGHIKTCFLPHCYKITNGLRIYSNTTLLGTADATWSNNIFSIIAVFDNKQQWIIDTADVATSSTESYPWVEAGELCPYNQFLNAGLVDSYIYSGTRSVTIKNISITAVTSKTPRENDSDLVHFIYGGIRLQHCKSQLDHVQVRNTWIGIARSATWYTSDRDLFVDAKSISVYFTGDMNGFSIYDGYYLASISYDNVDLSEYPSVPGQLELPTNFVLNWSRGVINSPILESSRYAFHITGSHSGWQDIAGSQVVIIHPWVESLYYDTHYVLNGYVQGIVIGGVYTEPRKFFYESRAGGSQLRLIGFNSIGNLKSRLASTSYLITDNSVQNGSLATKGKSQFGNFGNLIYSEVDNKYYMQGVYGSTGIDGFNYQTLFTGTTIPSEENLKIGTPFMLKQSDRTKPIFESVKGTPKQFNLRLDTVPTSTGNVTFVIAGQTFIVNINNIDNISKISILSKIKDVLSSKFVCYFTIAESDKLKILVPKSIVDEYGESASFTDTDNTGMTAVFSNPIAAVSSKYVDFMGNDAGFEYKFSALPATALEGTIGYWTIIQQPVYFKNGGWYDFPTNTKQEAFFEFSDHSTSKTVNVEKTGGTFTYTITSTVNNTAVNVIPSTGFAMLVSSSVTDNSNGTYTLNFTVGANVYTSDVEAIVYIYQQNTGQVITLTFVIAAADSPTNIAFSDNNVKTVFVQFDTTSDNELSYDEALPVTSLTKDCKNIVGTNGNSIDIDLRIFPRLTTLNRNKIFEGCNYTNIILPASVTNICSSPYSITPFAGMGTNNILVCLAINPPRIVHVGFKFFTKVYVPDISVDAYKDYKETDGYKYPSAKIFPISEIDDNALRAKLGLEPLTENEGE